MIEDDTTQELVNSSQEFLVPLRMGHGFSAEKFETFCTSIEKIGLQWKERDVIPKIAAILFIDAHEAMVASSYLYPSHTLDIQEKADLMNELIRACCS